VLPSSRPINHDQDLIRILGFRPLDQKQEQDFEDWLLTEGGFSKTSRQDIEDLLP
jgi:hypothetical protein